MAALIRRPSVKSLLPTGRSPKRKGLVGYVDQIGPDFVRGWAADRDDVDRPLRLRLYLDDVLVAEGEASTPRDDVKAAGFGDGQHGYQVPVPTKLLFCAEHLTLASVGADGGEEIVVRRTLRETERRTRPVLHLDASDLIEFLTHHRELSGIQRVQAGYLLSLGNVSLGEVDCRICTRLKFLNFFFEVPYERFAQLLKDAGTVPSGAWQDHVHRFKLSLATRASIQAGDTMFTLGAPWALDNHNEIIRCVKYFYGAHYLQIFYDLIPISAPEVVPAPLIPHFARAMAAMSIYADQVFSISDYAKRDLAGTLERVGRLAPRIDVVPMGATITDADAPGLRHADAPGRLGIEGPFVLCVGTLEPRKNHMLLFHVWRRLVATYGAANVPRLVLVGRVGWYMEDFMRMLKVTDYADRTILHLMGISNGDLQELYDGSLFTVFPSFNEGWGLPITESLARGKVCICSNVTSMPEAGGAHALYIDPYDTSAAYALCDRLIHDPAMRAEEEAKVRAGFRPLTWHDAADGLRGQLVDFARRARTIPASARKPVVFGRVYKFFNIQAAEPDATAVEVFANFLAQEDALDLLDGWAWFNLDVDCTWACGAKATLTLPFADDAPTEIVAYVEVRAPGRRQNARCEVVVDGRTVGSFQATGDGQRLAVPISRLPGRATELTFAYGDPTEPHQSDRLLGPGVRTIHLFARDDLVGRVRMLEAAMVERLGEPDRRV